MRLKEIIMANVFYMLLFIGAMLIFNPTPIESYAFSIILVSWVFFMVAVFMAILTFASMPFTRKLLEGEDEKFGVSERKTALYFFGMVAIATALLLSNVIPNVLIAAYSTSL